MKTTDIYRHLSQEYDRTIYWTDAGWARYCSIVGMCHALDIVDPEARIGSKLLAKLHDRINQLSSTDTTDMDGRLSRPVPSRKIVIGDDGTLHGFSFAYFVPIPPHADCWRQYATSPDTLDRLHQPICCKTYDPLLQTWQRDEPDSTLVGLCDVNRRYWVPPVPSERIRDSEGGRDLREYCSGNYDEPRYTGYIRYRYRMNGALIYHGKSDSLDDYYKEAVDPTYNPWSPHT
jgi:hypothetical protein